MKAPVAAATSSAFVPRNCVGSINGFGVIGDGVEVGPSSIPGECSSSYRWSLAVVRIRQIYEASLQQTPQACVFKEVYAGSAFELVVVLKGHWDVMNCCCVLPADAGSGLWTTRAYKKSELVTEYSGTYITHKQALQLREDNLDSHVRVDTSLHLCIDGIRQPQPGLGGASFCNDARNSQMNNAVFIRRSVAAAQGRGQWHCS